MLLKTAEKLKARNYKLGGMISQEIREKGVRVGFEIHDYATRRKGWLAHVRQPTGPRIGKYRVNLADLKSIGVAAILNALQDSEIVLIDEVGPMELLSGDFREAIRKAVNGPKPILGTIHYRAQHHLVRQIKSREDVEIVEMSRKTGDKLPASIEKKILKFLTIKLV